MMDKTVVTKQAFDIWFVLTQAELERFRKADCDAGRMHDDGGEPILYGPYGSWETAKATRLALTEVRSRRITWLGYAKRPKGLRAGWSKHLNREVIFLERPAQ